MRKAQARQLRGFLLFFDQILANYFEQLNSVKDLLSWRADIDKTTYFAQEVADIKDARFVCEWNSRHDHSHGSGQRLW